MKIKHVTRFLIIMLLMLFVILFISSFCCVSEADTDTKGAIQAMDGMSGDLTNDDSNAKFAKMINSIIGIIQVAGTGVAMIMVTVFGIKYIMASPSDKADVKKQIAPMIIGAIVLFGAVNLVDIVVNIAMTSLKSAVG